MQKVIVNVVKVLLLVVLLMSAAFLLAEKIDLTTADLGRHIKNGEVILSQGLLSPVLHQNFYSYTQPDFGFINHHWGTGVIFYWLTKIGGFNLDSIFYISLGVLTLLIVFDIARKVSNFWVALGLSAVLLPLMMSRTEVRPEMITYFFSAVFFWVLYGFKIEDLRFKRLIWFLPIITLLWVNIHIGWFFGPLLIVLFLVGEVWDALMWRHAERRTASAISREASQPSKKILRPQTRSADRPQNDAGDRIKQLLIVLIVCGVASLINPNFIWGALEPLTIFRHYGYLIVENQTIPFLERINHTSGLHFTLIKTMMAVLGMAIIATVIKLRKRVNITLILLGIIVSVMAWFGLRNFPFFGFFALPVLAYCIFEIINWIPLPSLRSKISIIDALIIPLALFSLVVCIAQTRQAVQARGALQGVGLLPGVEGSAEFYKQNNISGPIFNDYDIGGYLIYKLQADEHGSKQPMDTDRKVFVDNRPEAYSVDFFQNVYIPAQQDNEKWKQLDNQYNFNSIFFSYRDLTPWAQTFLINRVNDPDWAPVFVDSYNIIFLKRNQQNYQLIKKYELPKSMFGVTKS